MHLLTPEQAWKLIATENNVIILDVRTPREFEEKHISQAVNIPLISSGFEKNIKRLDRNQKYVLYCHSGPRAFHAAQMMEKWEFTQVYTVKGLLFGL